MDHEIIGSINNVKKVEDKWDAKDWFDKIDTPFNRALARGEMEEHQIARKY